MRARRVAVPAALAAGLVAGVVGVTGVAGVAGAVGMPGAAAATARPALRLHDPRITEASGIAVAERERGVLFVQNDSGDTSRFFAVSRRTGATIATIRVRGARNIDWEDIATARDAAGVPSVWLADIGDNDAVRRDVQVYRVPEPRLRVTGPPQVVTASAVAVWRLRYPGGPADAESLAVAPGGDAYIVTKSLLGSSVVYAVPRSPSPRVRTARRIGAVQFLPHGVANPFGPAGEMLATGAAMSRTGTLLAIRTYASAYVWRVGARGVAAALRAAPARIDLPRERQGEGVTFTGSGLLVDSEGRDSPVYAVPLPRTVLDAVHAPSRSASHPLARPAPHTTPATTASPSPSATTSPAARRPHRTVGTTVLGIVVLLLAAGVSVLFQRRRGRQARRHDPPQ